MPVGMRASAVWAKVMRSMLSARPVSCSPAQMRADGDREALRLLMCDRDNAVASCKTARTVLASVIVTAPASLHEQLHHLPRDRASTTES